MTALTYFVCATPRSGSTLVCELLKATGLAGRPEEYFETLRSTGLPRQPRQYFEELRDPAVDELLAPTDPGRPERPEEFEAHLADVLRRGTTENGVFAAKLMWGHLFDLVHRLAGGTPRPRSGMLLERFPGSRFVHVVRRDKVAQAVSLWTAVQTQHWRDDGDDGAGHHEPVYHFGAIDHLVHQLTNQEEAWRRWFATHRLRPHRVVYEDFVKAPDDGVAQILGFLGVDRRVERRAAVTPMQRQANDRSRGWAERYRDEREQAA